jgi:hypothetical protein
MDTARYGDLINFYAMLDKPEKNIGGARKLADCSGRVIWPKRSIYFFRESGEQRFDTGGGPRMVRVGTHALKAASRRELWTKLSQHKGQPANKRFRQPSGASISRLAGQNNAVFFYLSIECRVMETQA